MKGGKNNGINRKSKKMYLDRINQARKKIIDIQTRAQRDISYEEKKILDAEKALMKG